MDTKLAPVTLLLILAASCTFFVTSTQAQSVQVLSSRGFLDIVDAYYVYGEIQNIESTPIKINYITTNYYDSSGILIAAEDWYIGFPEVIYPNHKAPFFTLLWNTSEGASQLGPQVDHYDLSLNFSTATDMPSQLKLISYDYGYTQTGLLFNVTGTVENTGATNASFGKIFLTCYDASGKVVCTDYAYLQDTTLEPAQSSTFNMLPFADRLTDVTNAVLTVEGQSTAFPLNPPSPTPTATPTPSPATPEPSTPTPTPLPTSTSTTNPSSPTPTPLSPTPTPTPEETPIVTPTTPTTPTTTPNQQNTTNIPASAYTAWIPPDNNVVAASISTVVAVGVVSTVAVAATSSSGGSIGGLNGKIRDLLPEGAKKWIEEFISSKRRLPLKEKTCSPFMPTKAEILAYGVSLIALTIAFSYVKVPSLDAIWVVLPTILATAVIVELAKTYILEVYARTQGLWTEHRVWYLGLTMFLVTTFTFGVPFSSPSRNVYCSEKMTTQLSGKVASVAVLVTMAFAGLFFGLLIGGFALIGGTGLAMCIIMGLVDTFPVEPMNGKAIFNHKKSLWAMFFVVSLIMYLTWLLLL